MVLAHGVLAGGYDGHRGELPYAALVARAHCHATLYVSLMVALSVSRLCKFKGFAEHRDKSKFRKVIKNIETDQNSQKAIKNTVIN